VADEGNAQGAKRFGNVGEVFCAAVIVEDQGADGKHSFIGGATGAKDGGPHGGLLLESNAVFGFVKKELVEVSKVLLVFETPNSVT
jgi:hypothetical protein